jgi:hypothetical protein
LLINQDQAIIEKQKEVLRQARATMTRKNPGDATDLGGQGNSSNLSSDSDSE